MTTDPRPPVYVAFPSVYVAVHGRELAAWSPLSDENSCSA